MLELRRNEQGGWRAIASGDWTFADLRARRREIADVLARLRAVPPRELAWDLTGVTALDDAGAAWFARFSSGADVLAVAPHFQMLIEQALRGLGVQRGKRGRWNPLDWLAGLGLGTWNFGAHLRDALALLGQIGIDLMLVLRRIEHFPLREISATIYRAGVTALPVTMLVGFLVGVVLTYLSALQLKKYGADLLVINIVAVGVVRELGPMLASIISAGRSGSAMTAQIGVMRVTEEIEALAVMGVSTTQRLVLPKVIGLSLALPLVTFCTNMAALAGGMLVAQLSLGISYGAFIEALPRVLEVVNLWIGVGKSAVFGFAVAFVACHYGLRILPNTDSLAAGVTSSVVAAITSVILLDAMFAIMLRNVG